MIRTILNGYRRLLTSPVRNARPRRRIKRRLWLEEFEPRVLLSTVSWNTNFSGNWNDPGNWLDDQGVSRVPGPNDDVIIKPSEYITVTIGSGNQSIGSLQSNVEAGLVLSGGSLTLGATSMVGGSFTLDLGAALNIQGGQFSFQGPSVSDFGGTITVASGADIELGMGGSTVTYVGTLTASGQGTVSLTSGVMNVGSGGVTFNFPTGMFQWSGGSISVSSGAALTNAGFITVSAGNNGATLDSGATPGTGVLMNMGTIIETGPGNLLLRFGSTVRNTATGLYDFQGGGIGGTDFDGYGAFVNDGTLRKSVGGTSEIASTIGVTAKADGSIDVEAGVLTFDGSVSNPTFSVSSGATLQIGGASGTTTFDMAAGATAQLTSGNYGNLSSGYYSGTLTGLGLGTVQLIADITVASPGLTFNFPSGMFVWSGGNLNVSGTASATNAGYMTVAPGSNGVVLNSGTSHNTGVLTNAGTIIETGPGSLLMYFGSTLDNAAGSVYDLQGDGGISGVTPYDGYGTFINDGVLRKSVGGTSDIATGNGISFSANADGNINVEAGVLAFDGGLADATCDVAGGELKLGGSSGTTTLNVAGGATAELASGNYSGTLTGAGSGTVQLDSYMTVASPGLTFNFPPGMLNWTAGNLVVSGPASAINAGYLTIAGGANGVVLDSGTSHNTGGLTNTGTITETGSGDLLLRFGSTLQNTASGVYDFQGSGGISGTYPYDGYGTVVNAGTVRKSAGGRSALAANIGFDNSGTLQILAGGLSIKGGVAQISGQASAGQTLTGGTWEVDAGLALDIPGANITTNAGNIKLSGPGAAFPAINPLSANSGALSFLNGAGLTTPGDFINSGNLTLGAGSNLTVNGNYSQSSSGNLTILVGGTPTSGQTGQLQISGQAVLDGSLTAALANGFGPTSGQTFTVMDFSSIQGTFASFNGTVAGIAFFSFSLGTNTGSLSALTTAADLAAGTITVPASALVNQAITVSYSVQNKQNTTTTTDTWQDAVYLSPNNTLDSSAKRLGVVQHSGTVAGLGSYTGTLTASVPGLLPGQYYVLVVVDSNALVADSNRANNVGASQNLVSVDLSSLTPGEPAADSVANGQDLYYRLDVPPGSDALITGDFSNSSEAQVYVSQGTLPDSSHSVGVSFTSSPLHQRLALFNTRPGPYFLDVHGLEGAGNGLAFTLTARELAFEILAVTPDHGTTASTQFPITIHGSHFTANTGVALTTAGSTSYPAKSVQFQDSNTLIAIFDLSQVTPGVYDVTVTDRGQMATAPAAFRVATVVPQRLFTSNSSEVTSSGNANAVWSEVLPQPGLGNDSNFPSPFDFAGVQFTLDYTPGDHAILSSDAAGTQPFNVDGSWTLTLSGPVSTTLTGSGSQGPIDFTSLNLPAGVYGGQLTLTAPSTGTQYGTSDIYFTSTATNFSEQYLPTAHGALTFVGQPVDIAVGTEGQVPVKLVASPIPYTGMVTHFDYDPIGIQVLGFSVPSGWSGGGGGGGSIGSFSEYSGNGMPLHPGDVAFTISVRVLQPGNWVISFEGNAFGLGPTADPLQSLQYLQSMTAAVVVTGTAPPPSPTTAAAGITVNHTDGTLNVTITGSGLSAAASATLVDGQGNVVSTSESIAVDPAGTVLTAHFPVTPAGLYAMNMFDANGNQTATTGTLPTLVAPPAIPLFTLQQADSLPQLPGKGVTHLWRLNNHGTVDGVALVDFEFPAYLNPTSSLVPSTLPPASQLIDQVQTAFGWDNYIAVPLSAGFSTDLAWTLTLPPSAVFGPESIIQLGQGIPLSNPRIVSALNIHSWLSLSTQNTATLVSQSPQVEGQYVSQALSELARLAPPALTLYQQDLQSTYPDIAEQLLDPTVLQPMAAPMSMPSTTSSSDVAIRAIDDNLQTVDVQSPGACIPGAPTFVLVHGDGGAGSVTNDPGTTVPNDVLHIGARWWNLARCLKQQNMRANVLVLDWSKFSNFSYLGIPGFDFGKIASYIPTVATEFCKQLMDLEAMGCFDPKTATFIGESFGNYVACDIAACLGGANRILAFNPANELGGLWPPDLQKCFQNSVTFETNSVFDTNLSLGARNVALSTPYDDAALHILVEELAELPLGLGLASAGATAVGLSYLDHTYGVRWLYDDLARNDKFWINFQNSSINQAPPSLFGRGYDGTLDPEGNFSTQVPLFRNASAAGRNATEGRLTGIHQLCTPVYLATVTASFDPNSITAAPPGVASQSWIAASQIMTYGIHFENEASATASAESIRVVGKLDANLDPATVMPGDSSFASGQFAFDPSTGTLTWLLPNVNLPPNTNPPAGEGFVSFTASPKANLPTGTTIAESAQVFFDFNPPVATPMVVRTIDATPPSSDVLPLPTTESSTSFQVQWSGADQGSGIASFDVFVSDNGTPFTPFLTGTTQTSATFTGQFGHTYGFYSVATDNVGNRQATPTGAQAATSVRTAHTGRKEIIGRVSETGEWWVGTSNGSNAFTNSLFDRWNPNVTWVDVVRGDFNGDGTTDIAGRVLQTGQWWVGLSNGSSFTTTLWTTWNPNVTWEDVRVGDFNGDGKDDLVGRVKETGQIWVATSTGSSFTNSLWTTWSPAATWVDTQVGDFTGDGKADYTSRDLGTGAWWTGVSTGSSFTTTLWTIWAPNVTWVDVRVGDFTGDGKADIAGRVLQSGQIWVAQSTGSSFTNALWTTWSPYVTWVDVLVGDFTGDGKADLVGRVSETGQWWVATSTGSSFTNNLWATWSPSATWVDVQVGDYNGDGLSDITGRDLATGAWWTGLSNGSTAFNTTLWTIWNPAVTWVDVQNTPGLSGQRQRQLFEIPPEHPFGQTGEQAVINCCEDLPEGSADGH